MRQKNMARSIEFDREEVIQKALEIFWQEGYCNCSVSRLVEATHLQPGSLYGAFKSKEGLFLAALNYYGQQSITNLRLCLESAATPLQGIRTFIEKIGESIVSGKRQCGCFLVNTMLEFSPEKDAIKQEVNKYFQDIESMLRSALVSAHKAGELPPDRDPEALAKYLMVSIWGLQVLAKTNPDEKSINSVIDQILSILTT
ncbi:MAG: hypothetical protein DSY57_02765 [Desulfobulbus sp.]|nr:MAG: hypothetical protein DSY57_02765 [Desulfobulbus sp.]